MDLRLKNFSNSLTTNRFEIFFIISRIVFMKYIFWPEKMGCLGLEPRTARLKAEYSTIELATPTTDKSYVNINILNIKVFL